MTIIEFLDQLRAVVPESEWDKTLLYIEEVTDPVQPQVEQHRVRLSNIIKGRSETPTAQYQRDAALVELLNELSDENGGFRMNSSDPWAFTYEMGLRDGLYMDAECASAVRPDGGDWTPATTKDQERRSLERKVEDAERRAERIVEKAKSELDRFEFAVRRDEVQYP